MRTWGCLVALGVSCGVLCRAVFLLCISFLWLVLLLARSAVAVLERDVGQPKLNGRPKPESRPKPSGSRPEPSSVCEVRVHSACVQYGEVVGKKGGTMGEGGLVLAYAGCVGGQEPYGHRHCGPVAYGGCVRVCMCTLMPGNGYE